MRRYRITLDVTLDPRLGDDEAQTLVHYTETGLLPHETLHSYSIQEVLECGCALNEACTDLCWEKSN